MKNWVKIILLCLAVFAVTPAYGASGPELLLKGIEHYEFAEFDSALKTLDQAITAGGLSDNLEAKANVYKGLVYLAKGQRDSALKAFQAAKTADPGFKMDSNRYKPEAVELFNQAEAPTSTKKTVKEKPVKRISKKVAERGYVLEISQKEVTLDMGKTQGVKKGDQFDIVDEKILSHPATGKKIKRTRKIGVVQVTEVMPEMSFAKVIKQVRNPKAGMKIKKSSSPEKTQKTTQKATPKKESGLRLAVMEPLVSFMGDSNFFDPDDYGAAPLAKRINALPNVSAYAPDYAKLNGTIQATGYKLGSYVLGKRIGIPQLSVEKIKNLKVLEILTPSQVKTLAKTMDALNVDALLVWDVTMQDDSDQVAFSVNIHRKGEADPYLRETKSLIDYEAKDKYVELISQMVQQRLNKK